MRPDRLVAARPPRSTSEFLIPAPRRSLGKKDAGIQSPQTIHALNVDDLTLHSRHRCQANTPPCYRMSSTRHIGWGSPKGAKAKHFFRAVTGGRQGASHAALVRGPDQRVSTADSCAVSGTPRVAHAT